MTDFIKMHGLGNDFVLLDSRQTKIALTPPQIRLIADRHLGVGCDQIMIMHPPKSDGDIYLQMLNADGSEAGACGNGTRCVASILLSELDKETVNIETISGMLSANYDGKLISVNMGAARFLSDDIPYLKPVAGSPVAGANDTLYVNFPKVISEPASLVSMGNPHAVFFVPDCDSVNLEQIGPMIENHHRFPERTNVEFVEVISPNMLRMRVWERGAGVTSACGSGACAAAVAAIRRGLTDSRVEIILDGGSLWIEVLINDVATLSDIRSGDNSVLMTGPVTHSFSGQIEDLISTSGRG